MAQRQKHNFIAALMAADAMLIGCTPQKSSVTEPDNAVSDPASDAHPPPDATVHVYDEDGNSLLVANLQWTSPSGERFTHVLRGDAGMYKLAGGLGSTAVEHWRSGGTLHGLSVENAKVVGYCLIEPPHAAARLDLMVRKVQVDTACNDNESMVSKKSMQLSDVELLTAYEYINGRASPPPNYDESIMHAFSSVSSPTPCGELGGSALRGEFKRRKLTQPQTRGDVPNKDADWFDTKNFSVKYAFKGTWKLDDQKKPEADEVLRLWDGSPTEESIKANGKTRGHRPAPRVVQEVAAIAEHALTVFKRRGLTKWLLGNNQRCSCKEESPCRCTAGCSDKKMKIVVMKIAAHGETHPDWDHFTISSNNSMSDPRQNLITVPHELFHRIQYSYTCETKAGLRGMFVEGGAMLAEDGVDDVPNCYAGFGEDWSNHPKWQLIDDDHTGCKSGLSYAAGMFWKYFVEQCSPNTGAPRDMPGIEAYEGVLGLVREHDLASIRGASCPARPGVSFPALLADHFTTQFLAGIPGVSALSRFQYAEQGKEIQCPDRPAGGKFSFPVRYSGEGKISAGTRVTCNHAVDAWSGDFSRFEPIAPSPSEVHLRVNAPSCSLRVVRLDHSLHAAVDDGESVPAYDHSFSSVNLKSFGVVVSCLDQPTQLEIRVEGHP